MVIPKILSQLKKYPLFLLHCMQAGPKPESCHRGTAWSTNTKHRAHYSFLHVVMCITHSYILNETKDLVLGQGELHVKQDKTNKKRPYCALSLVFLLVWRSEACFRNCFTYKKSWFTLVPEMASRDVTVQLWILHYRPTKRQEKNVEKETK